MKHSLFWAAVEAGAKAVRSGFGAVCALVDCGIPRQHVGAQWLTAAEEEIEVWPGRGCGNDAGDGAKQPVVGADVVESPARPGPQYTLRTSSVADCLRDAYSAIKAENPNAIVVTPHTAVPADYDDEPDDSQVGRPVAYRPTLREMNQYRCLEGAYCVCDVADSYKCGNHLIQTVQASVAPAAVEDPSVGVPPAPTEADSLTHLAQCLRDAVGDHYDFACRPYDQFPFWHDDHLIDAFDWEGATTAFLEDVVRQLIDEK